MFSLPTRSMGLFITWALTLFDQLRPHFCFLRKWPLFFCMRASVILFIPVVLLVKSRPSFFSPLNSASRLECVVRVSALDHHQQLPFNDPKEGTAFHA